MYRFGLLITVFAHLICSTTTAATFSVSVDNATVLMGGSVTLPCWLSPTMDAEEMDVRWYRSDYNKPLLLYRDRKVQSSPQMEQYQNRTALMPREPTSSGLKQGDVSIRIDRVNLQDAGKYVCYVSSSQHYESEAMYLKVEVIGAPPILTLSRTEDDRVKVSCISTGWQPAPQLQWSLGAQQPLQPGGLSHSPEADGLFSVQSWVVCSSSESQWISCSVFLPSMKEDVKEARVDLQINSFTTDSGASPWMTAFIIALLAIIALVTAMVLHLRKTKMKKEVALGTQEEESHLLTACDLAYSEDMKIHAVDITIEKATAPARLKVAQNGKTLRDNGEALESDCELCALGNTGFSKGKHYWEVGLRMPNVPVKQFWWAGVATDSAVKTMREQKSTPTSGLWCLYSDDKSGVHTKSESSHYIYRAQRPEVLGIFLDYDEGRLSFYDTKLGQHLVTLKSSFNETVYPLFNPGQGETTPLQILSLPQTTPKPNDYVLNKV
ncbi:butyrophilin subfamily 1 member A1-like isoform X2 [Clupea harengus]|uniref:Butyrophilin subfamily 1 member A1-like isoform X2 n=1 Tax=Clupea harengus TaxID=7950 RepID=A0A6P3W2N3_CLUHA|nr:butyrophilin subfamily 1 member A1-like isoform X2 [Clupea harengus]